MAIALCCITYLLIVSSCQNIIRVYAHTMGRVAASMCLLVGTYLSLLLWKKVFTSSISYHGDWLRQNTVQLLRVWCRILFYYSSLLVKNYRSFYDDVVCTLLGCAAVCVGACLSRVRYLPSSHCLFEKVPL